MFSENFGEELNPVIDGVRTLFNQVAYLEDQLNKQERLDPITPAIKRKISTIKDELKEKKLKVKKVKDL